MTNRSITYDLNKWNRWLVGINDCVSGVSIPRNEQEIRPFVETNLIGKNFLALLDTSATVNLMGKG